MSALFEVRATKKGSTDSFSGRPLLRPSLALVDMSSLARYTSVASLSGAPSTDWLRFRPFKLKAMVATPIAVNQIPTTGHAARKKCSARELLKEAYWKIRRPKYPCAATMLYVLCSCPKASP